VFHPFLLVALCLTGKQEAAVRCFYCDSILPSTVAVSASRQAGGDAVTMVPVPQENFAFGKGILQTEGEQKETSRQ